jgi:hypothetical protein
MLTANSKTSSKTAGIALGMVLGFSEELRKIAGPSTGLIAPPKPKMTKPGPVAKSMKPEGPPSTDHLSSSKTNPPPPITAGGF